MNELYLKRLINIVTIVFMVMIVMSLIRETSILYYDFYNLTQKDKVIFAIFLLYLLIVFGSLTTIFKRKKIGWVGLSSYHLLTLILIFSNIKVYEETFLLAYILIVKILLICSLIFIFTKPILKFFNLKIADITRSLFSAMLLYYIVNINPIVDKKKVSSYYITIENDLFYLKDTLYSGIYFSNFPNGNIDFEGEIKYGKMEGEWKYYYKNENILAIVNYKYGRLDGKEITYFESGEIWEERNYKNGILDGKFELWFSPNEPKETGSYINGLKDGEWETFDEKSNFAKVEIFKNDSLLNTKYIEY